MIRLSPDTVERILALRAEGRSLGDISAQTGIPKSVVYWWIVKTPEQLDKALTTKRTGHRGHYANYHPKPPKAPKVPKVPKPQAPKVPKVPKPPKVPKDPK